ncbi:uncharacterized protein FFB20_04195 [Fusarium fujikuroi]|nr:uncharacterized protein FFB20_04195 [Fusarium fujikuroi]SCN88967.1 uncharacterized protein FFC1_05613 [Fusarium fujikuroi]SCN93413.1 uncharacterized protein FFE2_07706 [Fusarium fujikuroi]SCO41946.1 uncharacterized protein FFNC_08236 [Fusarium fujikuroi]SCV32783.1 uncharacterized protein FFFS_03465 [Fusarium fujikuroi]
MRPGRVVQRFVDRRRLVIQQLLQFSPGNILLVLQIIATLLIGIKREVNEAREDDIFDIVFSDLLAEPLVAVLATELQP